jgi:hypothetical protein
MKINFYLIAILILLSSCVTVSPNLKNEQYIKNNVQEKVNFIDSIRTTKLMSGNGIFNPSSDLDLFEITGFNYHKNKGIVIGVGMKKISSISNNMVLYNYETEHIVLNKEECFRIIKENKNIKDILLKNKSKYDELLSVELSINENLKISYESKNGAHQTYYINLWIKGKKLIVYSEQFINTLQSFLEN